MGLSATDEQFVKSVQKWRNKTADDELLDRIIQMAVDARPKTHPKLGGFVSEHALRRMRDETRQDAQAQV